METFRLSARNSLEEVEEAVARLLKGGPSNDSFLFPGQSSTNNVAMMIRDFTAKATETFRQTSPLSRDEQDKLVVLHFEEDLWRAFGLTGTFIPDNLLKECQKRLYQADKGIADTSHLEVETLMRQLALLDQIHRSRKATSSLYSHVHSIGKWSSLRAEDPVRFRTDRKEDFGHRFWALIIGNDTYSSSPLSGCVNDGILIQAYLIEYLGVPAAQISFLRNATRQAMIDGLYDLRDNDSIHRNDNIFIHFSGHGTSYDTTEYFTTFAAKAGSIEGICPVDRGPSVPDISDRELNSILYELQQEKGNNITLFLDCFRSGGALRSHSKPEEGAIRYIVPLRTRTDEHLTDLSAMFEAADNNKRRRPKTPLTSCESWVGDIEGFVQLASCHDFQLAKEGVFKMGSNSTAQATRIDQIQTYTRSPAAADPKVSDDDIPRGPIAAKVKGAAKLRPQPHQQTFQRYGCFTWALISALRSKVGRTGTYEDVIAAIGRLSELQDPIAVGRRKASMLWYMGEI